jgi:hypothetical protein
MGEALTTIDTTQQPVYKIEALEKIVRERSGGAALLDEFTPVVEEANYLVQHNRRVAYVWQRYRGPDYAKAVVKSGFEETAVIPKRIGEVTLEDLLLAMATVLQRYGSIDLRRAIAVNAYDVLRCACECVTLLDIIVTLGSCMNNEQ